jgi:hypothetical protein
VKTGLNYVQVRHFAAQLTHGALPRTSHTRRGTDGRGPSKGRRRRRG